MSGNDTALQNIKRCNGEQVTEAGARAATLTRASQRKWHLAETRIKKKAQGMQRSGQSTIQAAIPASARPNGTPAGAQ